MDESIVFRFELSAFLAAENGVNIFTKRRVAVIKTQHNALAALTQKMYSTIGRKF